MKPNQNWIMECQEIKQLIKLSVDDRAKKIHDSEEDYVNFFTNIIGCEDEGEKSLIIDWKRAFNKTIANASTDEQNKFLSKKFVKKLKMIPEFPKSFKTETILKIILGKNGFKSHVKVNHIDENIEGKTFASNETDSEIYELYDFCLKKIVNPLHNISESTKCKEMKALWLYATLKKRKKMFESIMDDLEKLSDTEKSFFIFDKTKLLPEKKLSKRSRLSKSGDIACLRFNLQSLKENEELESEEQLVADILLAPCNHEFPFRPLKNENQLDKNSPIHKKSVVSLIKKSLNNRESHDIDQVLYQLYQCMGKGIKKILPNKWNDIDSAWESNSTNKGKKDDDN